MHTFIHSYKPFKLNITSVLKTQVHTVSVRILFFLLSKWHQVMQPVDDRDTIDSWSLTLRNLSSKWRKEAFTYEKLPGYLRPQWLNTLRIWKLTCLLH